LVDELEEEEEEELAEAAARDMEAAVERDPACGARLSHCFLDFKGFQACQVSPNYCRSI
jgi:serine acetyltransferase